MVCSALYRHTCMLRITVLPRPYINIIMCNWWVDTWGTIIFYFALQTLNTFKISVSFPAILLNYSIHFESWTRSRLDPSTLWLGSMWNGCSTKNQFVFNGLKPEHTLAGVYVKWVLNQKSIHPQRVKKQNNDFLIFCFSLSTEVHRKFGPIPLQYDKQAYYRHSIYYRSSNLFA